jgi:hypothetical protein
MSPAAVMAIISLVQVAITETPALVAEFQTLFGSDTPPTPEQFQALLTKIQNEQFNP